MGPSQPSGSMSPPPSSHPQGPTSPPASTAASSTPFVRSHHDELPEPLSENQSVASELLRGRSEQPRSTLDSINNSTSMSRAASSSSASGEGEIAIALKCPSLDKDSAVVRVRSSDTVLVLKQTIEATWPGAPRAEGMRCIRSGRILSDNEVFSQLTEMNRPTPSRRSSYLRQQQQQQQLQQSQVHNSLPRSALSTQIILPENATADDVPPRFGSTSTQLPSSYQPAFGPYFSEPSSTAARSTPGVSAKDDDAVMSGSIINAGMNRSRTAQDGDDAYSVLEDVLKVTAPDNWPLLVEALKAAYDEYVLIYERIYNEALVAQKRGETASPTPIDSSSTQSDLLTSVETTLLGWDPIQVPGDDHANATSTASTSSGNETRHLYQQVSHRGLPYLLRISTTPLAVQRSEALCALLQRITTLGSMIEKLENVIMLGRLIPVQHPAFSGVHGGESASGPLNGAASTARDMALERVGIVAGATRIAQRMVEACRGITFTDVTAVIVPMAFVGFKVGILLSIMLQDADKLKKYFLLGMASVYVVFESYRIVQRRMRVRQRMAPRVPVPVPPPPPPPAHQQEDDRAAEGDAGQAAAATSPTAPMGANVPTAPLHEEQVERQATQDPLRPLPPPQAPARIASRPAFSLDWCIDQMAFVGLDAEDAELGLLPALGTSSSSSSAPNSASRSWVHRILGSEWVLPLLLFCFTMMPAVEQRRKRAIEERERVIRKWTRLEQERRERVQEMLRAQEEEKRELAEQQQQQQGSDEQSGSASVPAPTASVPLAGLPAGEDLGLQQKRAEYADRMLRQRRNTEAVDMDDDDDGEVAARRLARQMQDDEEEAEMDDLNIF
ncbi:hypothetical protein EX895_000391 [Sporisorium graminicola]|uniref:Ubiquitin-like domain-containing protein n=1 Tax=Sporisorium graminicola TaxID=280036 RepID=A0A4U7KZY1_9BASI|nr:hypothetical protein EX895_000391 [Sporisorium graminicola]TKY90393.1 hypothetical protein EX895_000391 [Sporisorium graminicola]